MFTVTRQIGIDAGHRVTTHGSKCRSPHGHRYTIHATIRSDKLIPSGEQTGMVLDFGFLKEEMMNIIDADCDHGMMIWVDDHPLMSMYDLGEVARANVREFGFYAGAETVAEGYKVYVLDCIPTAENLAKHWFHRLEPRVVERSIELARLQEIRVDETPNCSATYTPPKVPGGF